MGLFDKFRKTTKATVAQAPTPTQAPQTNYPTASAATVFCPKCGHANPTQSRFCGGCGNQLGSAAQETRRESWQGAVFGTNDVEKQHGMTYKARSVKLHKLPSSYVAMDLETTGFDSLRDGIIEIAGVKVVDGNVVDTFQTLVDTDAKMSAQARAVNGITRDMLKGAPKTDEAVRAFVGFANGMPLLGHNAIGFDRGFVEHACARIPDIAMTCEWVDTMKIAKDIYDGSASLETLCEKFGVANANAHRALSDAMATHECYQAMRADIALVTTDARDFPEPSCDGPLSGEVVCFTGESLIMSRHDAMMAVVEHGGSLSNSVTKKTTMLVSFEGRDSGKAKKAREYGVRTIGGEEFMSLIG